MEEMRSFGYICPHCGKAVLHQRSVFALSAAAARMECECGQEALEAETDAAWTAAARAAALYNPRDNTAYTTSSGGETRRYVYLAEDGGFHRTVADDSVGYAFQGTTRTFIPKAGAPLGQLYDDYNRGYYPTLASHSATIQYEDDKSDPTANVFTFTYVHAENIGYTVEYRYHSDDRLIPDAPGGGTVEKTTQMAVVTERFAVIANYIPDAFYKRLVLAVEKDENGKYVGSKDNVVTFYYTPDVQNAYYAVHHMLQDLDAEGDALTPDGNLSLIDDIGGSTRSGKQFITVETKNGNVFYLIIDRDDEGEETVHFLNQVDEADLLTLMGDDAPAAETPAVCNCKEKCVAGAVNTNCPVCKNNLSECSGKEAAAEPEPEAEQPEKKSSGGLLVIVLLLALAGGGAFAYVKFIKPKQGMKVSADPDDYDFEDEEMVNEDEQEDTE